MRPSDIMLRDRYINLHVPPLRPLAFAK